MPEEMTPEEMRARIAQLEQQVARPFDMRVSAKGAVSLYKLQRFPVTLYKATWRTIIEYAKDILQFIEEHDAELK